MILLNKIIGIIGGAGVAATNKLLSDLEIKTTCRGARRDYDHPEIIVHYATKAPSRSLFLEGKGPSFYDDYLKSATILKNSGANTICMCCNTAHVAIDYLSEHSKTPFINMVMRTVEEVRDRNLETIGLMASDGCLMGKVYERYFSEILPDIEIVYPDDHHQRLVTLGICNIKNTMRFTDTENVLKPSNLFDKVYYHLTYEKKVQSVILGCTDISVDFKYDNKEVIDSLDILSNEILKETGIVSSIK